MEEKVFKTLKGTWISGNVFIDEENISHRVVPYSPLYNSLKDRFPIVCYILLFGNIVKDIVEID